MKIADRLYSRAVWLTEINRFYLIPTIFTYWDEDCSIRFGITFVWLKIEISLDSGY